MENQNVERVKSGHGGARQGAGRKRGENSRNIRASFMLSADANEVLERLVQQSGTSKNDVINTLLEAMK